MQQESNSEFTIQELETELSNIDNAIESFNYEKQLGEAMQRLYDNEDFKLLFKEYYGKDYLNARMRDLAGAITEQPEKSALNQIKSIAIFKQFCETVIKHGLSADDRIAECMNVKEQILLQMETM